MQVKINGTPNEIPDNSFIQDVLLDRTLPENLVVIELNGEIIKRGKWASQRLKPGDNLELIQLIGGG